MLVVGATPGMPLAEARKQVTEGIAACIEHTKQVGVLLAIEPLHPMYAPGDQSCVNSMTTTEEKFGKPLTARSRCRGRCLPRMV